MKNILIFVSTCSPVFGLTTPLDLQTPGLSYSTPVTPGQHSPSLQSDGLKLRPEVVGSE